jgi:hypothetical protein
LREVAVRLLRLFFTEASPTSCCNEIRILCEREPLKDDGLLVDSELNTRPFRQSGSRRRKPPAYGHGEFCAGMASLWLDRVRNPDVRLRATCRVSDDVYLEVTGELPWKPREDILACSQLGEHGRLDQLGFVAEHDYSLLRLKPTTPEAMIRFSASLARSERLVLRSRDSSTSGRVIVRLRDFEGKDASMPAIRTYANAEVWLRGVPSPSVILDLPTREAIVKWICLPESWPDWALVEGLV